MFQFNWSRLAKFEISNSVKCNLQLCGFLTERDLLALNETAVKYIEEELQKMGRKLSPAQKVAILQIPSMILEIKLEGLTQREKNSTKIEGLMKKDGHSTKSEQLEVGEHSRKRKKPAETTTTNTLMSTEPKPSTSTQMKEEQEDEWKRMKTEADCQENLKMIGKSEEMCQKLQSILKANIKDFVKQSDGSLTSNLRCPFCKAPKTYAITYKNGKFLNLGNSKTHFKGHRWGLKMGAKTVKDQAANSLSIKLLESIISKNE